MATPTEPGGMWSLYEAELRRAQEEWREGAVPPPVSAVAAVTGLNPEDLHDWVEDCLEMYPCDDGYQYAAWYAAWAMHGYPDWAKPPEGT